LCFKQLIKDNNPQLLGDVTVLGLDGKIENTRELTAVVELERGSPTNVRLSWNRGWVPQ
jgi:hypothetical protein